MNARGKCSALPISTELTMVGKEYSQSRLLRCLFWSNRHCEEHSDCAGSLKCMENKPWNGGIPGCANTGITGEKYCYNPYPIGNETFRMKMYWEKVRVSGNNTARPPFFFLERHRSSSLTVILFGETLIFIGIFLARRAQRNQMVLGVYGRTRHVRCRFFVG